MNKGQSLFIGFRDNASGQFTGKHITEEQLSGLISLLPATQSSPDQFVFPDLSPLIRHISSQIEDGFKAITRAGEEMRLKEDYELLFTHWNRACGMDDGQRKERAWEKVTDRADPMLIRLRESMPSARSVKDWDDGLIQDIEQKGRMYTEVMLIIIYARAAYERSSLGRDPSLREYCRQIKEILATHTGGSNALPLMLSAASEEKQIPYYTMLREINGRQGPESADSFLAQHVRAVEAETLDDDDLLLPRFYNFDVTSIKQRQMKFISFSSLHWRMVMTLAQIHYRVSQLEALLDAMIKNDDKVDFDSTGETRVQIEKKIAQLAACF